MCVWCVCVCPSVCTYIIRVKKLTKYTITRAKIIGNQ